MMTQHLPKLYRIMELENHLPSRKDEPVYIVRDGKFFRTAFHPDGWSELPDYDLGNDGRVYRTENHPDGFGKLPDYEFGLDGKLYRTLDHPRGKQDMAEYEIID